MNVQICATFPPDYQSLYNSVRTSVMDLFDPSAYPFPPTPFPPFDLTIPALSTIPPFPPTIAAPSLGSPTLRVEQFINEMSTRGITLFIDMLITAVKNATGIEIPTPTIFGIKLTDLITKTFDELAALYTGPTIASMSATFSSATQDLRRTIQAFASGEYLRVLYDEIVGKLQDIKDILDPGDLIPLPVLPTVPTRDAVIAMLYAQISPRTDLKLDDLFDFTLAGFDLDMSALLPNPISPFSQLGAYDLEQGIKLLMAQLVALPLITIKNFLDQLGLFIVLPPFCLIMQIL